MGERVRVITANVQGGSPKYISYLISKYKPDYICLQEQGGKGPKSTRVRGIGKKNNVRKKKRRRIVPFGVHNTAHHGVIRIDGKKVKLISSHNLHRKSVGSARQTMYLASLGAWTRALTLRGRAWIVGIDGNTKVKNVRKTLGGRAVGSAPDAIVVSKKFRICRVAVDSHGRKKKWTDHDAIVADIWFK